MATGVSSSCHFLGPLSGLNKWAALAAADIFVLPSYQENFAIALVEALSVGTPALISQRVNIWGEIEAANAGCVTDLNPATIAKKLTGLLDGTVDLKEMGLHAQKFAKSTYNWQDSAKKLLCDYASLLPE